MRVTLADDGIVGRCTLGIAHEGPPGYGHGGMSAMPLDELMGWACAAAGTDTPATAVTASRVFVSPDPDRPGALFPSLREGSWEHPTGKIVPP
jgi:hypothetical protein